MRARRAAVLAGVVLGVLTPLLGGVAVAYPGAPWFEPGKPYTQNFPDPDVVRVGGTYYAYATNTGGSYLPAMSSTDLNTWIARPAYDPGPPANSDPYFNDALPYPAAWAPNRPGTSGHLSKEVQSPGVVQLGGRYIAFYTVLARVSPPRRCISLATASSPLGPFSDNTSGPLQCDADPAGSIDPSPFVDDDGTPYLVWKSEGVPGSQPTRLWSRRLTPDGLSFAPGSAPTELLHTTEKWEGNVIENPSMIRYGGRLLLFYSANEWASADYAIGFADCASPTGPCTKRSVGGPLMASQGDRLGPGGPSAFVDAAGHLRVAYHYWNAPYTNYPAYPQCKATNSCTTSGQRRMAIAQFDALPAGAPQPTGPPRPAAAAPPSKPAAAPPAKPAPPRPSPPPTTAVTAPPTTVTEPTTSTSVAPTVANTQPVQTADLEGPAHVGGSAWLGWPPQRYRQRDAGMAVLAFGGSVTAASSLRRRRRWFRRRPHHAAIATPAGGLAAYVGDDIMPKARVLVRLR